MERKILIENFERIVDQAFEKYPTNTYESKIWKEIIHNIRNELEDFTSSTRI